MTKRIHRAGLVTAALVLGLLGLLTESGWSTDSGNYQNISMDQFLQMMAHKDFVLINVHIPYAGEIPQTDLLIPFNAVEQHKTQLPQDKDAEIVVYCVSGPMGYVDAEKLAGMGYTRIRHFEGGINAWESSGRTLKFRTK